MRRSELVLMAMIILAVGVFFHIGYSYAATQKKSIKAKPDKVSLECMNCHKTREKTDHAIGGDYKDISRKSPDGFLPIENLSPNLKLVDGKLSCVTCHIPYSKKDHKETAKKRSSQAAGPDPMLTIDNAGSALCASCHKK